MPFTKRSKVKEVWCHPVGHDLLLNLARRFGRDERWLQRPTVANRALYRLDRLAGAGFSDMVLEMTADAEAAPAGVCGQAAWWRQATVYQIYLPGFMDGDHDGFGDLLGVVRRLPYLARLGVDTLLLWPPADEGGRRDHPAQNSVSNAETDVLVEDFRALAEAAHQLGMRVVISIDIASTSDRHPWFRQTLAGELDGFYVMKKGAPDAPPNNWSRTGMPPVWKWYPQAGAWALRLHGRGRVDLDWDNPAVRGAIAQVLDFWRQAGADGFFLGAVGLLSKTSYEDGRPAAARLTGCCGLEKYAWGPKLHGYLRQLRAALPAEMLLLGDACGAGTGQSRLLAGAGRGELDMVMDLSHLGGCGPCVNGREAERLSLPDLKYHYLGWMEACDEGCWMPLVLETPDTPRAVSRFDTNPLYRVQLAKLLNTLLFTLRGTPMVYQGGELGLANIRFSSPDELRDKATLRRLRELSEEVGEADAFRQVLPDAADHARAPIPWSAGANAGFSGAAPWLRLPDGAEFMNAALQMEDEHSVWQHTRRLIELRRQWPAFVRGSFEPVFRNNKRVFCYFRIDEGEKWYVEMNLTDREVARPGRITPAHRLVLSNYEGTARALRPLEANVYRCE